MAKNLRIDLLAPAAEPALRDEFRRYADLRASPPDLSDPRSQDGHVPPFISLR